MPLGAPPLDYEDLIEGQPGTGPGGDAATDRPSLRLASGWQNEFGLQRYFRVVGVRHLLLTLGILRQVGHSDRIKDKALQLVPKSWHDEFFPQKEWQEFSFDQFDRAYGKDLQRFDRAALSILYLHAAIEELKLDCNLYHMVRIRPVTFFIDGYTRAFYDRYVQPREKEIKSQIIQPAGVLAAMADGQTFVTRKTADLLIRVLPEVQRENLTVECGQLRSRSRGSKKSKTIWPCASEQVHFHEDEYLSPAAWNALTPADKTEVATHPLPRFPVAAR